MWLLAVALFVVPAVSQALAAPDAHRAKAKEYYELISENQNVEKMINSKVGQFAKNMGNRIPKEAQEELIAVVKEYTAKYVKADFIVSCIIDFYAENFSDEELSQMVAYEKTPAARRMRKLQPELGKLLAGVMDNQFNDHKEELMQTIKDVMVKYRSQR